MKGAQKHYPDPFQRSGRGSYYFVYTDPRTGKRKQRSTGATTKKDAYKEIKTFIDKLHENDVPERGVPFSEYAAPFFVDGVCPRQARKQDERESFGLRHMSDMRRGLERVIGRPGDDRKKAWKAHPFAALLLGKITRNDVYRLRRDLSNDPGGRTGQQAFKAIKTVLAEAVVLGHLDESPAAGVGLYKRPKAGSGEVGEERRREAFTLDELRSLWKNRETITTGRYVRGRGFGRDSEPDTRPKIFLSLLLGLGGRVAELRALRWGNVDLEAGRVSIVEAMKGQLSSDEVGLPKWGRKRVNLAIPAPLVRDLLEHRKAMQAKSRAYVAPDVPVVCNADRKPVGTTFITKLWKRVRENAAALPEEDRVDFGDRYLTPHSCRHSLNTWTLTLGAPPLQVQEYLGWESEAGKALAAMQRHYGHFELMGTGEVARVIETILEGQADKRRAHGT